MHLLDDGDNVLLHESLLLAAWLRVHHDVAGSLGAVAASSKPAVQRPQRCVATVRAGAGGAGGGGVGGRRPIDCVPFLLLSTYIQIQVLQLPDLYLSPPNLNCQTCTSVPVPVPVPVFL